LTALSVVSLVSATQTRPGFALWVVLKVTLFPFHVSFVVDTVKRLQERGKCEIIGFGEAERTEDMSK
jgi:hypothetical protein